MFSHKPSLHVKVIVERNLKRPNTYNLHFETNHNVPWITPSCFPLLWGGTNDNLVPTKYMEEARRWKCAACPFEKCSGLPET